MASNNQEISKPGICGICYEETSLLGVNLHDKNPCSNFSCCEECAFTYLAHKIKEKDVSSVTLICPGCREPLTSTDVHRVLSAVKIPDHQPEKAPMLTRYEEALKVQNEIDAEKNRRLQRTFPSIGEVASDIALSCWSASKDTGRCPGCRTLIEKNGGCQHMSCRSCNHQWWWCCGRTYGKSHNEVLCAPIVYMNHQSRYWGPNILVRTVTKTTVAGVGIGLAATAAGIAIVAVPTVVIAKTIDQKSGLKERRRKRRQQQNARLYEQRRPSKQWTPSYERSSRGLGRETVVGEKRLRRELQNNVLTLGSPWDFDDESVLSDTDVPNRDITFEQQLDFMLDQPTLQ